MKVRKKCRICKGKLKRIIRFDKISLVGKFNKKKINSKKFPITLNFCQQCKHTQIAEIIDQAELFKDYFNRQWWSARRGA